MADKDIKRYFTLYVIRELQIKTTEKEHYTYQNGLNPKQAPNAGKDMEQEELSIGAHRNTKWYSRFSEEFGGFLQKQTYSYHTIQQFAHRNLPKGVGNLCPHNNLHRDAYSNFICNHIHSNCRTFIDVHRIVMVLIMFSNPGIHRRPLWI